MAILITGASGFIGTRVTQDLEGKHELICMSRKKPQFEISGIQYIQGAFGSFEDLRKLDKFSIHVVIHLAAALGDSSEEEALATNVMATRRLLRYLIDNKCDRFILASSIAATGCLSEKFIPLKFPMPDDHPCLAVDPYGLSKAMMEDITYYFNRVYPELEFINLRYGAVIDNKMWKEIKTKNAPVIFPVTDFSKVFIDDVVCATSVAAESLKRSGVHIYNVVGPDASCDEPVVDMLSVYFRDRIKHLDLSWYKKPGNEHKPLFSMNKIKNEFGFVSKLTTQPGKIL